MVKSTLTKRTGKYGRSKFRAFTILMKWGDKYGHDGWLSTRDLCIMAGLPYRSLTGLLTKWVKYEYVAVRVCHDANNVHCEYKLINHGEAWLICAHKRLHTRSKLLKELQEWVNVVMPYRDELLAMKFNKFVDYINVLIKYQPVFKKIEDKRLSFNLEYPFMDPP